MEKSQRQKLLEGSIALTCGDRDKEYGDPKIQLRCAGELKRIFWHYALTVGKRTFSAAEEEAINSAITKLSRLACGIPKPDTYVDLAAYIAIAFECMAEQFAQPQPKQEPKVEEIEDQIKEALTHVQSENQSTGSDGSEDSDSGGSSR